MFPDASEMSAVTLEKREKRDDDRQNRIPVRAEHPQREKRGTHLVPVSGSVMARYCPQ